MQESGITTAMQELLQLLLEERKCAQELRMADLMEIQERKQELLRILDGCREFSDGLRETARRIRFENRRNAYLLHAGLNWVREMMSTIGKSRKVPLYGRSGQQVTGGSAGALLTGEV